ncbi:Integrase/recombinase xerD like protein [Termitomyces sp. T112]|nr:Integrase/recombinase xerD like protein [Termitomyces sp. T112]
MSRLHASPAASPSLAAAPSEASTFVPPIPGTGINGASSAASLSLHTHFPDVDMAVIVAIITHEFKASDLHKLDPTNWDKETAYTFNGSTNQFKVSNQVAREAKTPFSVIISLQSYFDILSFHISNVSAMSTFFRYMAHLIKLIAKYKWSAVYDYHVVFFNRRRTEIVCAGSSTTGAAQPALVPGATHTLVPRAASSTMGNTSTKISQMGGQVIAPIPLCLAQTPPWVLYLHHPALHHWYHLLPTSHSLHYVPTLLLMLTPPYLTSRTFPMSTHPLMSRHGPITYAITQTQPFFTGDRSVSYNGINLKSALSAPSTIDSILKDITTQVNHGQMQGPYTSPPFDNFCTLPIGAVTRKRSTKICHIHHLLWPKGSSVNDGIADSEASIMYDTIDCAINDLIASGPGSLMLKLNLESAFRHIPVQQQDWPLLGFEWLGRYYPDLVLVFGACSAPYIFNLFTEALHWILQRNVPAHIRHYLNDFLSIFMPETPALLIHSSLNWALDLGSQLGLSFQPSKIVSPDTKIEFLGLELDSIAMEAYLALVRSLHVDADLPFTTMESPLVQRLLWGIKHFHSKRDHCPVQPITLPILTTLLTHLRPGITPGHTAIYAACCVTYSGLLCSREFTIGKGGKFSTSLHLSQSAVQFLPDFTSATHVWLTLPASKTNPFCKGITITMAAAHGRPSCPVTALKAMYAELPCDGNAPLFEQPNGSALSYTCFVTTIRDALSAAGINPAPFTGHSFQHGATSTAAATGYSDYEIQLLGRWHSDSYKLYIENDPACILHLSSLLHMAHTHLAPFEPLALQDYTALA